MNKLIGVIGAQGFIGSNIFQYFLDNEKYDVMPIYRNQEIPADVEFDVIINAGGNAKKRLAESQPLMDFRKNVYEVYESILNYRYKKYVLIGSIDSIKKDTVYANHKYLGENIVKDNVKDYLILRCGSVLGRGMKKGIVYDIINDMPVYLTAQSTIQFVTTKKICELIEEYIEGKYENRNIHTYGHGNLMPPEIAMTCGKNPQEINYSENTHEEHYNYQSSLSEFETSEYFLKEYIENERMEKPV